MGKLYRVEFGGLGLSQGVEQQPDPTEAQQISGFEEGLELVIGDLVNNPGTGFAEASAPADIALIRAWQQGRRI